MTKREYNAMIEAQLCQLSARVLEMSRPGMWLSMVDGQMCAMFGARRPPNFTTVEEMLGFAGDRNWVSAGSAPTRTPSVASLPHADAGAHDADPDSTGNGSDLA